MKYKLPAVILGLPVAPLIFLSPLQPLGHLALSSPECRVQKWYLPRSIPSQSTTNGEKSRPLLLRDKAPFTCCKTDSSCIDEQIFGENGDRKALLTAIDRSLKYLRTPRAVRAYRNYKIPEITHDHVQKSLIRFRQILLKSRTAEELNTAITKEFVLYQSVGHNGIGSVLFTSYYEPIYTASRIPTP